MVPGSYSKSVSRLPSAAASRRHASSPAGMPNRSRSGAPAKGRVRMPAASRRLKASPASSRTARENRGVPPRMRKPASLQKGVEPRFVLGESRARRIQPIRIGERARADRDRRTADRPGPERGAQASRNIRGSDGEAEAKPREPVGLAEGAQDDGAARGQRRLEGFVGAAEIGEGLVDDQHSAAPKKPGVKIKEVGAPRDPPVRIVGIDDDRDVEAVHGVERGRVLNRQLRRRRRRRRDRRRLARARRRAERALRRASA